MQDNQFCRKKMQLPERPKQAYNMSANPGNVSSTDRNCVLQLGKPHYAYNMSDNVENVVFAGKKLACICQKDLAKLMP